MVKNLLIVTLIVSGLAFSGCASTQQTNGLKTNDLNKMSASEIREYNSDPNNAYMIVCETETRPGSRLGKKVCSKVPKN